MRSKSPTRVSVVIACYNYGRFLAEAIDSILCQTVVPDEIIVVDDGSVDDTALVASKFPQVRYVRQGNKGVSAARNRGFAESTGEYVVFLDADDRFLPRAIEAGLACFRKNPGCGFVFGAYRDIAGDGSILSGKLICHPKKNYYRALCQGNFINMHATVLYLREAFASTGGFNEGLRAAEDYDVYLRVARNYPVGRHEELVAEYRHHRTSASQDNSHMLRGSLWVLEQERQYLTNRYRRVIDRGVAYWIDHYRTQQKVAATITHMKHHGMDRTALQQIPDLLKYLWRRTNRKIWGAAELIAPAWFLERW